MLLIKSFHHLMFNCNDPKSIISALNFLHLGFFSVQCSNALVPEDASTGGILLCIVIIPIHYNLQFSIVVKFNSIDVLRNRSAHLLSQCLLCPDLCLDFTAFLCPVV